MADKTERLVRCFTAVFPKLQIERIPAASVDNLQEWDSLATMTLLALLEQEFGTTIDLLDVSELSSFESIQNYLRTHNLLS